MAADTITRGRLRRLAELRPENGRVLSVFFNLDPSEFATPAARATEVNSVLTAAAHKVEALEGLEHGEHLALREDVERVRGVLTEPAGRFPAGTPYAAGSPELLLWILATLADSALTVYPRYVRALEERR